VERLESGFSIGDVASLFEYMDKQTAGWETFIKTCRKFPAKHLNFNQFKHLTWRQPDWTHLARGEAMELQEALLMDIQIKVLCYSLKNLRLWVGSCFWSDSR